LKQNAEQQNRGEINLLNTLGRDGLTALRTAVKHKKEKCVDLLLPHRAQMTWQAQAQLQLGNGNLCQTGFTDAICGLSASAAVVPAMGSTADPLNNGWLGLPAQSPTL